MSSCIHTIFNPEAIDAGFSSVLGPIVKKCPAVLIPLAIPIGIVRRVLLTLQHIARVLIGPFLPLHKLEENYYRGQKPIASCGIKTKLWFKDIGCILISPILLLKDVGLSLIAGIGLCIEPHEKKTSSR